MTKKIGIITKSDTLKERDTIFLLANEAIQRPHLEVYAFDSADLSEDRTTIATTKRITCPLSHERPSEVDSRGLVQSLLEFDAILLRKDIPVDASFQRLLETLAQIEDQVPVINSPKGIFKMGTKAYLENFPTITPPTFYTHNLPDTLHAVKELGDCIVKQSDGYGGQEVSHFSYQNRKYFTYEGKHKSPAPQEEIEKIIDQYLKNSRDHTLLVVKFLKSAAERGDKRSVILEGEKILGTYLCYVNPKTGFSCCGHVGKRYLPDKRDYEILEVIGPHLKENGIALAGLDQLSDGGVEMLSEINVINPGFYSLHWLHPELKVPETIIDLIEGKMYK